MICLTLVVFRVIIRRCCSSFVFVSSDSFSYWYELCSYISFLCSCLCLSSVFFYWVMFWLFFVVSLSSVFVILFFVVCNLSLSSSVCCHVCFSYYNHVCVIRVRFSFSDYYVSPSCVILCCVVYFGSSYMPSYGVSYLIIRCCLTYDSSYVSSYVSSHVFV